MHPGRAAPPCLTEGPELTGDRLQQTPPRFALGVGVHVDGALLAVAPRRRHDDIIVRDFVAPSNDLDGDRGMREVGRELKTLRGSVVERVFWG